MKISVHIEADSAEELQAALAAFHVKGVDETPQIPLESIIKDVPVASMPLTDTPLTAQDVATESYVKRTEEGIAAQVVPLDEIKTLTEKPESVAKAPVEPKPTEKPARGRPGRKTAEPAPVAEAPVAPQKAPVEPIQMLTRKDLLDVFSEYVARYGVAFGYNDVSALLQQHFGNGVRKASDVADKDLASAIRTIKSAINDNPFNRKRDYAA
jgi:hypothetical protein